MQNRYTAGFGADTHIAVGEIHGIDDVTVFQIIHHLLNCHLGAVILRFLRGSTQVRDRNDPFHIGSTVIGEVGDIALDLT